jgi:hypothetical protein
VTPGSFFQAVRHPRAFYRSCRWALSYERLLEDIPSTPSPALRQQFDETGIAFIHIPKAAGTSVQSALYGKTVVRHGTWEDLRRFDPQGFARWTTLAVVREPLDRFMSAYDYLLGGGTSEFDQAFERRFLRGRPSIARFVDEQLRPPATRARILAWVHFRPQAEFVVDATRTVRVRRLVPYNRLDEMLPALLPPGARLRRLNATKGPRTTRAALSPDAVDLLLRIYRDDVELFQLAHDAGGADVDGRVLA